MAGYISNWYPQSDNSSPHWDERKRRKDIDANSIRLHNGKIVDGAGMDAILVGDSASNVMAGNVTTLPITLDQMIYHGKSVCSCGE